MKPINILLVEDNEGDIFLTIELFQEMKMNNNISIAKDGKQAVEMLSNLGIYANDGLPNLVLLDMNLPKKNGLEVLQFIKNTSTLKHIPVIMITTSSSENDIMQAYENAADGYITKPLEVLTFISAIASIKQLGFSIISSENN